MDYGSGTPQSVKKTVEIQHTVVKVTHDRESVFNSTSDINFTGHSFSHKMTFWLKGIESLHVLCLFHLIHPDFLCYVCSSIFAIKVERERERMEERERKKKRRERGRERENSETRYLTPSCPTGTVLPLTLVSEALCCEAFSHGEGGNGLVQSSRTFSRG